MKKILKQLSTTLALTIIGLSSAHATLFDRGNGMIYDSDQDITCLQDANYAFTSGYDADGQMDWDAASTWADSLTIGGYTDWRLATITDNGNDGCNFSYNGTDCGWNVDTSGSELAYLWYDILGNKAYYDTSGNAPQAGWGLTSTSADGVDFINVQPDRYWSGTEYAPNLSHAWQFNLNYGSQGNTNKNEVNYSWAVRTGDVPEPATLLLLVSGLLGFAGIRNAGWRL